MTNAERFIGDEDLIDQFTYELSNYMFDNLGWYEGDVHNLKKTIECFFKSNIKPQLTEDERVILRNICFTPLKDFYIERRHGTLKLHNRVDELYDFFAYDHLFHFIKERRRI